MQKEEVEEALMFNKHQHVESQQWTCAAGMFISTRVLPKGIDGVLPNLI